MAAVLDSVSSATDGTSGSTLSWSHILGNLGGTGLITVCAAGEDTSGGSTNQRITGITFNGVGMTLVNSGENTAAHSLSVAIYELHGVSVPAAGTYTVTVTYTASCESRTGGAMSFTGVKNQVKEATTTVNANTTNPMALSVTTVTNNALVVGAYGSQNTPDATATTGDTRAFRAVPGSGEQSECCGFYKTVAVPASTSTSLTVNNPEAEALVLASFQISQTGQFLSTNRYW